MHLLTIPAGASARAHLHETAIYVLGGTARMRYGPELEKELGLAHAVAQVRDAVALRGRDRAVE
jgi:uncharacterized RmlC-like cupin family protein